MSGVDVVVPCYNYGRYLPACVDSLLAQEGVAVRVLVLDDASTDDSPEIGQRLAARDPRVEFRRHASNHGHIATYNEGLLGWARADYSLLISADDALPPGALGRATRLMERHPEVGMTYGKAYIFRNEDAVPAHADIGPDDSRVLPGARFLEHCFDCAFNPVPTPTVVVRTALQQAVGGYSPEFPHSGDLEMWMRFALRGPIGVLRSLQGFYRWHDRNMGAQYYGRMLGDRREFLQTCDRILAQCGPELPAARWRDTLYRRVGESALRSANRCLELDDPAACEAWLSLAQEVHPRIRKSHLWLQFQVKRRVGAALWRPVRSGYRRLRGIPDTSVESSHFKGFHDGQRVGWWPGAS